MHLTITMNHPHIPISPLPPFFDLPPLLQKTTGTDHAGASSDEPAQKISKRPKTGCLTCRLRKKVRPRCIQFGPTLLSHIYPTAYLTLHA